MLTCILTETGYNGQHFLDRDIKVHGLVNRGGWFGETWLVVVSISNAIHAAIVVEGEHAQAVIDELADSPTWSHLIDIDSCNYCDSPYAYCQCEYGEYAGNDSHRIMTDNVSILARCKVNYFAKPV